MASGHSFLSAGWGMGFLRARAGVGGMGCWSVAILFECYERAGLLCAGVGCVGLWLHLLEKGMHTQVMSLFAHTHPDTRIPHARTQACMHKHHTTMRRCHWHLDLMDLDGPTIWVNASTTSELLVQVSSAPGSNRPECSKHVQLQHRLCRCHQPLD